MVASFHRCCTTAYAVLSLLLWTQMIGPSESFRTTTSQMTTQHWRPPLLVASVMKKTGAVIMGGRRGAAALSITTTLLSTPDSTTQCRPAAALRTVLSLSTNPDDQQPEKEEDQTADPSPTTNSNNDIRNAAAAAAAARGGSSSSSLDPLFTAVTKMDVTTATAKTIPLPLWGDLILDRSLFYLLPIAAFGLIGLITSIIVLLNSTDDFATAIAETRSAAAAIDDESCRGLCSNPNNVEGLRQYMMGISGQGGRP
jgi:hypothetical protein